MSNEPAAKRARVETAGGAGSFDPALASTASDEVTLLVTINHQPGSLATALDIVKRIGINMTRIESRPSKVFAEDCYDMYIDLSANEGDVDKLCQALQDNSVVLRVTVAGKSKSFTSMAWFPRQIADLDLFAHKALEYGEELNADHPGFQDLEYRKRRTDIVAIAKNYRHGEPIPRIEYTKEENGTWGIVYRKLRSLHPTHACSQLNRIWPLLERNCGFSENQIPQLEDISKYLQQCTGWRLRPVQGLLSPRDFLNGLAYRVFHSTQYIRHHSKPLYTPEPDVCHELLGHVPLFCDPEFAAFSQDIGIASLGASDDEIEKLARCYWFTVEFGLCEQEGKLRAYGAGLLSSFGELEYSITSDKAERKPLDIFECAETTYPITTYQPLYFVASSFADATKQLAKYAASLQRPYELCYNPFTQSIDWVDSTKKVKDIVRDAKEKLSMVEAVLERGRLDE